MSATLNESSSPTTLSAELTRSRTSAYRKYADLLRELLDATCAAHPAAAPSNAPRADPSSADAKLLTGLRTTAAVLGRTPAEVESDAAVLSRVRAARHRVSASRGARAAEAEALKAVQAYDAESAALIKLRKEGYRRLYEAYRTITATRVSAMTAVNDVNKLIAEHPELLAAEPPATLEDVG